MTRIKNESNPAMTSFRREPFSSNFLCSCASTHLERVGFDSF